MQNKNEVVQALLKEIEKEAWRLDGQEIRTIYFGGGTPSLLTVGQPGGELDQLMEQLHRFFRIHQDAEITLEANPDDIRVENLAGWKAAGINRLSIGVQSFREQDLQWMNRAHTAGEAESCIRLAREAGFDNLTIDLIYGTPGLSDQQWQANVEKALELGIPHLSCYALTVEPKTALAHMVKQRQLPDTDPEQQGRQFLLLMDWMRMAGFEHYEISNFARPGFRSRHNSSYWQGHHYLGFGPGAHSFDGCSRRWNISNNALYVKSLLQNDTGGGHWEEETLTPENRFNEYVMTALRTIEGIDLRELANRFGEGLAQELARSAARHNLAEQRVSITEESIRLTDTGKLFADGIAADLFI